MARFTPDFPDELGPVLQNLSKAFRPAVIFDVGAFRGNMTRDFMTCFPDARYHLFEPQPEKCEELRQLFGQNSAVTVSELALSEASGTREFHIGRFPATSSLFPRNLGKAYFAPNHDMAGTAPIQVRRLDEYCSEHGIGQIDILKLDTQGAELSILKGAGGLLRNHRIHVILTEFFAISHYEGAPLLDEIWGYMRSCGYDLYRIFLGAHAPDGQLRYGDALFLSRSFREQFL